jgi:glycosyltransferase involved in cell wall biosynthesis
MKGFKPHVLFVTPHSIEPYGLTPNTFARLESHPHKYCKAVMSFANTQLAYMSLSVKDKMTTFHKYGYPIIAYPVSLNKGRFNYEISKMLLEDILRSDADILHIHNYYSIIFDIISFYKIFKIINKPILGHYHGGSLNMMFPLSRILKRITIPQADKLIVTNRFEAKRLIRSLKISKEKIAYIHDGVDVDFFKPLGDKYKENDLVLFVGNLMREKGVHKLLYAFYLCKKRLKNLKLLIVGDGYLRNYLERKIKEFNLQNDVKLAGRLSFEELRVIYNRATVTVLPSMSESLGMVLLESMACKTPVIATINEGSLEIITHMEDGILVPQNDIKSLSDAICMLITNDDLREEMGERARQKVLKSFSFNDFAKNLQKIYKELLEKK